ncbi:MAG: SAM-dependent chlorinase/fluorinase [Gammaproteobacteria bacterium]|nr:SAM-dependent chlorinase/fluorinase [Gammaproteobacteria bacterium]
MVPRQIVLMTDFGCDGIYTAQLESLLYSVCEDIRVITLFTRLPAFNIQAAAYLLPAYTPYFPATTIFICVVDPGVGSERPAVLIKADEQWFIGPDNGLFELIKRRASTVKIWHIDVALLQLHGKLALQPSYSFHGRDIFAPLAVALAKNCLPPLQSIEQDYREEGWPDEWPVIIYIDAYGNLISGLRGSAVEKTAALQLKGCRCPRVNTFSEVLQGQPLCYMNANGLLEIAVNGGSAANFFTAKVGDLLSLVTD